MVQDENKEDLYSSHYYVTRGTQSSSMERIPNSLLFCIIVCDDVYCEYISLTVDNRLFSCRLKKYIIRLWWILPVCHIRLRLLNKKKERKKESFNKLERWFTLPKFNLLIIKTHKYRYMNKKETKMEMALFRQLKHDRVKW